MALKPVDTTRGRLRTLHEWLTGTTPSAQSGLRVERETAGDGVPACIGRYSITHKLGEGGMGVGYAARDERLERTVALKTISAPANDEVGRSRFWREARAAASVSHPNIHLRQFGAQPKRRK